MIDFTKLQANPIPPGIAELQKSNANLVSKNEKLKRLLKIGAGILALYVVYKIYKKQKENEADKKNKLTRD